MRFHHTIQNGAKFKTSELFIPGTFHSIFLDLSWILVLDLLVTEIAVGKTTDKGETTIFDFWPT